MKYEKEYRKDMPETIGETDYTFDLSNYADWLEGKLDDLKIDTIEPLAYLSRAELQLNILKNINSKISGMSKNNGFRWWWDHSANWVKVQELINGNTIKAGSTSSGAQCHFIGLNPDSTEVK